MGGIAVAGWGCEHLQRNTTCKFVAELSVGPLAARGTAAHSKTEAVHKVSRCAHALTFVIAHVASWPLCCGGQICPGNTVLVWWPHCNALPEGKVGFDISWCPLLLSGRAMVWRSTSVLAAVLLCWLTGNFAFLSHLEQKGWWEDLKLNQSPGYLLKTIWYWCWSHPGTVGNYC